MTAFKLYYTTTSCGAANFIVATIGGLTFDSETVDLRSHKTQSGADFFSVNPKGNVPTIAFSDGSILCENVATLTYLADKGSAGLAPKAGTPERYRYLNDVAFIASELHQGFAPFFNPQLSPEARAAAVAHLLRRADKLSAIVGGREFLNGKSLSAADVYAYIVLSWAGFVDVSLPKALQPYFDGLKANEAIQKAQAAMAALQ